MTVKEQAIQAISELPNSVSFEEIMDNLLFLSKIKKGADQLDQGLGLTTEELKKKLLNNG